jgi:hypothetical protein
MKERQNAWTATFLESSLPWIQFGILLISAAVLIGFEFHLIQNQGNLNARDVGSIVEMENANRENEIRLSRILTRVMHLEEGSDSVLSGLLRKEQETPNLKALEGLGVQDAVEVQGEGVVRVRLAGKDLEYHRFVPLLSQQEVNTPLMRCLWLSLKSSGKPFSTSALPLQVDLELAFPRTVFRDGPTAEKLAK